MPKLYLFLPAQGGGMEIAMATEISVGDILQFKKSHPCGSHLFRVMRIGMDFKLKCEGCSHIVEMSRGNATKRAKKVIKEDDETI